MEKTAQARHAAVSVVVDAAKRHVDAIGSTKGGNMHTPRKKTRPDKKQRALFSQFVDQQKAKLAAQPYEFDIESVKIPTRLQRLVGVEKSLETVKMILYTLKKTLTTHSCLQQY